MYHDTLFNLGILFESEKFRFVNLIIKNAYNRIVPKILSWYFSFGETGCICFARRGVILPDSAFNVFFSDLDLGVVVEDERASDKKYIEKIKRKFYKIKSIFLFLGEIEIYSKSEKEALEYYLLESADIYEALRDYRQINWLLNEKKKPLNRYHLYKYDRKIKILQNKNSLINTTEWAQLYKLFLPFINNEFLGQSQNILLQTDVKFYCQYLSQEILIEIGETEKLLFLSCIPFLGEATEPLKKSVDKIRQLNPGVATLHLILKTCERLIATAYVRGARHTEEWHKPWLEHLADTQQNISDSAYCGDPFERIRITAEGDVFFCCFQRTHPIGNLRKTSIESIWSSNLASNIRRNVNEGLVHSTCRVEACPKNFIEKNKSNINLNSMPIYLDIDPPNFHCNIGGNKPTEKNPACIMCERNLPDYRFEQDYSAEVLPKLQSVIPYIKSLHIQGVAEVFWKNLVFDYLNLLGYDKYKKSCGISTVTNGTLFNSEKQTRWINSCLRSSVSFSIDAATPETYKKIRRLDVFNKVCENILSYSALIKNYPSHVMTIQHNINTLNISEVEQMVDFAAQCSKLLHLEFNYTGGNPKDILLNADNQNLFKEAYEKIIKRGKEKNVNIKILRPFC